MLCHALRGCLKLEIFNKPTIVQMAIRGAAILCRPDCEGDAPSTRFRHTTAPINPSPGTPLHDLVSEALGGKQPMSSGQLLLVFGGYNTIGEEFGANSTFVSCCMPASLPVVSCHLGSAGGKHHA